MVPKHQPVIVWKIRQLWASRIRQDSAHQLLAPHRFLQLWLSSHNHSSHALNNPFSTVFLVPHIPCLTTETATVICFLVGRWWTKQNVYQKILATPETYGWIKNSGHDKYRSDDPITLVARSWWSCYGVYAPISWNMAREIHRNPLYKWRFKAVNIIYQWNQWWIFHQAMFMIRGGIQISRLLLDSQPAGNSISNGKSRKEPHKCAKPLCMYIYIYT